MRPRRATRTIEFTPPGVEGVAAELTALRQGGSGWINLMPGVDEESAPPQPAAGLFAFLGTRTPPVAMVTLMPPAAARRDLEGVTVGVMHPTGGQAVARLGEAGAALPARWALLQDHTRRGLLVRTPVDVADVEVVEWSVRAGAALCRAATTGRWQAVVYLP